MNYISGALNEENLFAYIFHVEKRELPIRNESEQEANNS